MKTTDFTALMMLAAVALQCHGTAQANHDPNPAKEAEAAAPADEDEHEQLPDTVTMTAEVVEAAHIATATVALGVLPDAVVVPGEVVADPDRSAQVAAPVAGRIERVLFQEGQAVRKGDPMVVLRVPELAKVWAARAGLEARARANRRNADRLNSLADQGLAARQDALAAQSEAAAQISEAQALAQQMSALGIAPQAGAELTVRAPIDGQVTVRSAVVGQPVDADHVLATVVDLSQVWFAARLFERDLARVRVGAQAVVTLNGLPNLPFAGKVEAMGLQLDSGARTVLARVGLRNRDGALRLGLFGSAQLAVGQSQRSAAVLVPVGAVVAVNGQPTVFVSRGAGLFRRHGLTLGAQALGQFEVQAGLAAGEVVVVDGAFSVLSALLRHTLAEED